jgi:hypothetical protein
VRTPFCLTLLPYLITEYLSAGGFAPEPECGARIQATLRLTGRAALAFLARSHGLFGGTERACEE